MLRLELPFPISTNHYWRLARGRHVISSAGKAFADEVFYSVKQQLPGHRTLEHNLRVQVELYPPDYRRRDLDNFAGKSLFDALQRARVYIDDSQIRELHAYFFEPQGEANCVVLLEEF